MAIPNNSLSNLEPGVFVTLEKVHPAGTLQVRKDAIGATYFYWRCTHLGRDFREPIGTFDTKCPPLSMEPTSAGYSRRAAAIKASELAILHKQHLSIGGFPGYLRQLEQARQESERIAQEATEELRRSHEASLRETEARSKFNLSAMLMEYCDYLASLGRSAHSDARSIFALHITEAFPTTAAKPANEVTPEEIADMMRRLIELGKDRTANKLRSYVRAAYAVAKAARSKASIPLSFKAYRITVNPAAETSPDESANRPDKRPLSIDDLRTYWSLLQEAEGIKGVALRIHLLSGGQRIAQILRLIDSNITDEVALIFDGKGRPGKPPRPHPIPITAPLGMELDACKENRPFRLSTDNGKTHIATGTLSNWAVEAVGDRIPGFLLKRVRSGVETALASAKVPKDYRSRLQSHGISGVQATHYDGYDYLEEKRKSMELLYRILTQPKGKVVQFAKGKTP